MKKLIVFAVTMLLSLTAFSQTDTTIVCLPTTVARQIAIDLAKCDSIQADLTQTQKILKSAEETSAAKDIVISEQVKKIKSQAAQIAAYEESEKKHKKLEGKLRKDLDSANSQAKFFKDGFTISSIVATVLGGVLWFVAK